MFCPLCRTVFCRLRQVYLSRYSGPYSPLRVCGECAVHFGHRNAVWYILSCGQARKDHADLASYVLHSIPRADLVRCAVDWGCPYWDYDEALRFVKGNPRSCPVFSRLCDRVFKTLLL